MRTSEEAPRHPEATQRLTTMRSGQYESYDICSTIRTVKATHILSDLELALLGFIREEPRSGYVLRKAIADFPQISDSPGAIYPALRRLKTAGLIDCSGGTTGRKTEVFRVT